MKHDLCPSAAILCRTDVVRLNSPDGIYDYPGQTLAQSRIIEAVMATRGADADRNEVVQMVNSLWECEG